MSAKVKLEVVEGVMKGESWVFEEHDMFLFGRLELHHSASTIITHLRPLFIYAA